MFNKGKNHQIQPKAEIKANRDSRRKEIWLGEIISVEKELRLVIEL